jgi:hypothetical protein
MPGLIPYNRRLYTFGAKSEISVGTKATLAAADCAFRVMNPKIVPIGASALIPAGTGLGNLGAVVGAYSGAISFDWEMYNNSSVLPAILLPSCGFALTATAGTYQFCDVISAGATANSWQTITAGLWFTQKGSTLGYGAFGAMGALSLQLTAGMPIMASLRYSGVYGGSPGSLPTGVNYETTLPPVFNSFTVDGSSAIALPSVAIDGGDYVVLVAQPNTQGAVLNAWLKKPEWSLKIDPLQDNTDWIADWTSNGTGHTFTAVAGTVAGNIITISGVMVQKTAPGKDERDELLTTPLEFSILNNSLKIAFT